MYPASQDFLDALRYGQTITTRVDVLRSGVVVASGLRIDKDAAAGVNVDANAAVRRTFSGSVLDPDGTLTPAEPGDTLSPYGNELAVYRGLVFPSGVEELVPLGVFRLEESNVLGGARRATVLDAYDRSSTIAENRFDRTYVVAEGTNYATAIRDLVLNRLPGVAYQLASTSRTTPLLVFAEGEDPWRAVTDMARNIGMEALFDAVGTFVLRPEPDPATDPSVFDYLEGEVVDGGGSLLDASNRLSSKPGGFNGVIVTGEGPNLAAPVRAEAWDDDPASPTYYLGPYGKRPTFYRSTFFSDPGAQTQAQETADTMLRRVLGGTEQVRFVGLVNPAHEAGDVVRVKHDAIRVDDFYLLDAFTVPLSAEGDMVATTRKRRSLA